MGSGVVDSSTSGVDSGSFDMTTKCPRSLGHSGASISISGNSPSSDFSPVVGPRKIGELSSCGQARCQSKGGEYTSSILWWVHSPNSVLYVAGKA